MSKDLTNSILEKTMNDIIDERDPRYKPTSDEMFIYVHEDYGIYQRSFKHDSGREFLLKWTVWYGTPDTVKTVFHPVHEINTTKGNRNE